MKNSHSNKVDLLVLSHGRQGTLSVNLALALADNVFCPSYNATDSYVFSGDADGVFSPEMGRYSYQAAFPQDLDLKFALVYHGFVMADGLPGSAHQCLKALLRRDTPAVIFARDPSENFKSSYKKYLSVFEARKYFSVTRKQALFDRDSPLSAKDFFTASTYVFDYDLQVGFLNALTDNVLVKSFSALRAEEFNQTIGSLCALMGVRGPDRGNYMYVNSAEDLEICTMFSNRNRFSLCDKYHLFAGVFPTDSHDLVRGSFETKIPNVPGLPGGFDMYVSSPDWFVMPLKLRELVIRGRDPWRVVENTAAGFQKALHALKRNFDVGDADIPANFKTKWERFALKHGLAP